MAQKLRVMVCLRKARLGALWIRLESYHLTQDCRALSVFYRVWTWPYLQDTQCSQRELVTPGSETTVNRGGPTHHDFNMFVSKLVILPLFQWYARHSDFTFYCPWLFFFITLCFSQVLTFSLSLMCFYLLFSLPDYSLSQSAWAELWNPSEL